MKPQDIMRETRAVLHNISTWPEIKEEFEAMYLEDLNSLQEALVIDSEISEICALATTPAISTDHGWRGRTREYFVSR